MTAAVQPIRAPALAEDELAELQRLIAERSFRRGRFTLASGIESALYFNLKPTMMHPRGAYLAARAFLAAVLNEDAEYVGGLEMGAVPLLGAVAVVGEIQGRSVGTFFVRKQAKDHGTRDLIEGLGPTESLAGKRTIMVDDVATSGGSIFGAIKAARATGAIVEKALVLVDREEGAEAFLADNGVRLLSVLRASQFA